MDSKEFYQKLSTLPSSYCFNLKDNKIVGTNTRRRDVEFNPITAVASNETGQVYRTNKRDTFRAAKAIGLTPNFTDHVYKATAGVSNRGNAQVVRGKIKSALGV